MANFLRRNISGISSNCVLALMLGLTPALAGFFGLPLDVRHVTLSAGQLAAALATLGAPAFFESSFWWAVAAIPLIGCANLLVSFFLALRLASSATRVSGVDRSGLRRALWNRVKRLPRTFFVISKSEQSLRL